MWRVVHLGLGLVAGDWIRLGRMRSIARRLRPSRTARSKWRRWRRGRSIRRWLWGVFWGECQASCFQTWLLNIYFLKTENIPYSLLKHKLINFFGMELQKHHYKANRPSQVLKDLRRLKIKLDILWEIVSCLRPLHKHHNLIVIYNKFNEEKEARELHHKHGRPTWGRLLRQSLQRLQRDHKVSRRRQSPRQKVWYTNSLSVVESDENIRNAFFLEIKIMQKLKSKYIVRILDVL